MWGYLVSSDLRVAVVSREMTTFREDGKMGGDNQALSGVANAATKHLLPPKIECAPYVYPKQMLDALPLN